MTSNELKEKAKHMNPINDLFFRKMAENAEFCLETIWAATGDHSIRLDESKPQAVVTNLQGRGVILDVYCVDKFGKRILIEVQRADDDNHVFRVRYNTSVTTANITDPGSRFENIPRIMSIYISENDFIAKLAKEQGIPAEEIEARKRAVYHVDRIVRETGQILDDGIEEIYVNGKVKDGSEASEMMTIYTEDDAYDMDKFPAISKRKWMFKHDDKEVDEMGYSMQDIKNEGYEEGRVEGRAEGRAEVLKKLVSEGVISSEKAESILEEGKKAPLFT